MPTRDLTPDEQSMLLTQEQVDALPDGTQVFVKWAGGNGPHEYSIGRDEFSEHSYALQKWHKKPRSHEWVLAPVGIDQSSIRVFLPLPPKPKQPPVKLNSKKGSKRPSQLLPSDWPFPANHSFLEQIDDLEDRCDHAATLLDRAHAALGTDHPELKEEIERLLLTHRPRTARRCPRCHHDKFILFQRCKHCKTDCEVPRWKARERTVCGQLRTTAHNCGEKPRADSPKPDLTPPEPMVG